MSTYDGYDTSSNGYVPTEDDIRAYNEDQARAEAEARAASPKLPKPKLLKSVRQPITIHVRGRQPSTCEAKLIDVCDVYADVLAIHKLPKSRDFNITHIPTGLSIIDYVSPKAKAVECVAALLEDGAEVWVFGEFGKIEHGSEHHKRVKRVLDKALALLRAGTKTERE